MAAPKKSTSKAKKAPASKSMVKRKASSKRVKQSVLQRTTTKKTTAGGKKAAGPVIVGKKPFSKSQLMTALAEQTGLSKKDVLATLEAINTIIGAHVHKQGPNVFSWPGLFKIQVVKKPATKARPGVNPFTGESMMFKAKPASRKIKVRPLKQLKALVA